ncbi:glycosyltransferase [Vibrio sp. St2]|uniref:glycosyltransferase n=1 Tax=Vibrio sp. St2 TaxID=2853441 RepID=UPI00248D58ED|nr:glycosyltransferase [Vibrio sp. St2]
MYIAIRLDLYEAIGWGHFMRSLTVAKELIERNHSVKFIFGQLQLTPFVKKALSKFEYVELNEEQELSYWELTGSTFDIVIYDVAHHDNRNNPHHMINTLNILKKNRVKSLFFDGAGEEMISSYQNIPTTMVVVPYACSKTNCKSENSLIGPEYFILDKQIKKFKFDKVKEKKILFTFGGSDPTNISYLGLKLIKSIIENNNMSDYQFIMVCGPGYNEDNRDKLLGFTHPRYKVMDGPSSLGEAISSSQLVITATGLTKYEVAYLGVPAIHISSSKELADINKHFVKTGAALDLGLQCDVEIDDLVKAITTLLFDENSRNKMILNAMNLVDGDGLNRIVNEIELLHI